MKKIYLGCLVGSLACLLSGCKGQDNEQDPTPKSQVKIRITGTDVSDLGADYKFSVERPQQPEQLILASVINNATTTASVGSWDPAVEAILVIEFSKVSRTSQVQPRPGSAIKGEILVNDQVKATIILDQSTPYGNVDFPANYAQIVIGK